MDNKEIYLQDLERGEKDREADIKKYGEQFVNRYRFKSAEGVRYNVVSADEMFKELKQQAQQRGKECFM